MNNGRDCEHGQLARSCDRCADAAEIAELRAEVERLRSVIEEALPFQLHVGARILNQGLEAAPDGVRVKA